MAKVCCVKGCSTAIEGTFFKFPNSRTLRRKWMDVITTKHNNRKLIDDSLVCSIHFLEDQYEVIRGKTRLKSKVVPSLFVRAKSKSPDPSSKSPDNKSETNTSISEDAEPKTDIPTKPPDKDANIGLDIANDSYVPDIDTCLESRKRKTIKENGDNIKEKKRISDHSDFSNKDIEDIITNYHIKQDVPNKIHSPENADQVAFGQSQGCDVGNGVIEINDDHAEPQFIEISADKGQNGQPDGQDCLMVLENVQVEIDPSLMFPGYDEDTDDNKSTDSDVIDLGEKKNDPISLLTSSDEDEVIIEEPKIDTVEVSDDTEEDDVPLVKLVKGNKNKSSKKEKKIDLQQVMWGGYGYYCVQCNFTTQSGVEFRKHKSKHSTVLEVCQLCSYTTASKSQFIRHKRKHKFEKRYQCHLCEYKAKHHMSLLYHIKTHSALGIDFDSCFDRSDKGDTIERIKQKYYKCDDCKYKSVRRSDLKRHRRKIHQDYDDDEDVDYTPG